MRVLVTGATGFIGSHLVPRLKRLGYSVIGCGRDIPSPEMIGLFDSFHVFDVESKFDLSRSMHGIDCVIHLAARVHVTKEKSIDPLNSFREVNVEGTRRIALAATQAGVKRFILVSSLAVNGQQSDHEKFTEESTPHPQEPYGVSKLEAENELLNIHEQTGLEYVIIRPPLVYGPGVKANFRQLLQAVKRRLPLPLAALRNRRSIIYVGNLCSALITCLTHENARNQLFLVGDADAVSTPKMIELISANMNRKPSLFYFPNWLLQAMGKIPVLRAKIRKITGNCELNDSKIRSLLGWSPPTTTAEGFQMTVDWFTRSTNLTEGRRIAENRLVKATPTLV